MTMNTVTPAAEPHSLGQAVKGRSLWAQAMGRLRQNKAAVGSILLLALIFLACFAGPYFVPYTLEEISWGDMMGAPTWEHPFGFDESGRDLLVRTLYAGRVSLIVGLTATLVSLLLGVAYGAISGYVGGRTDNLMMRAVDIMYAMPFVFFVILLAVFFKRPMIDAFDAAGLSEYSRFASIVLILVAIGAVEWLDMARIVRGQTLSLKRKEFIEAAHACGVKDGAIIRRHIVPNTLGPVVVYVTLTVPRAVLLESFLSFLGLGVDEPMASWGSLISEGSRNMEIAWWQLIYPGAFLAATLFCFNFIGDGLRDALDPKDR